MSEKSEQMKTSEAAQALGVSENTLRKYSQAVEKAASPAYFPRVKNTRRYRPEDLTVLKQMQDLVKAGQKVDQAAQELLLVKRKKHRSRQPGRPAGSCPGRQGPGNC